MAGGVEQLLKGNKVTILRGEAEFKDAQSLKVTAADGVQEVRAKNFVVATGSRPIAIPGFEFDEKTILSSTGALALQEAPGKVIVIGGGYIGLEIGSLLNKFGSAVTVVEATSSLLSGVADSEAVQIVARRLKKNGVQVILNGKAKAWSQKGKSAVLTVEVAGKEEKIEADKILVMVGRRPNSDQMNLRGIGLVMDERGFIKTNAKRQTNLPHIYAIGDIAGQPMLAHKASHEAVMVAEIIAGKNRAYDVKCVPAVIFTDPEMASVGWTEEECRTRGYTDLKIGKFPFAANGKAVSLMETDGFVKIIADAKNDVVLGVHIVGPEASNLISEAALAIEMGATLEDLALTIHPHPTLGETMMEAAEAGLGHAIHVLHRPLSGRERGKAEAARS